jgi:hypothetical protein
MAETMNRKVQRAAARVEVPAKLNDADVLKLCHADAKSSTWLSDRFSGSR